MENQQNIAITRTPTILYYHSVCARWYTTREWILLRRRVHQPALPLRHGAYLNVVRRWLHGAVPRNFLGRGLDLL